MKKIVFTLSVVINICLVAGVLFLIQSLGGVNYMLFKMKNRGATGAYEMRKSVFEVLPKEPESIVFVGNSIIQSCEWSELLGTPVKNRGIIGESTSELILRLSSITEMKASSIFLMIGVNDLIYLEAKDVLKNYSVIVERIHKDSPSTKLFLQSVLPVNTNVRSTTINNNEIHKLNAGIKKIAEKNGDTYIELNSLFVNNQGLLDPKFTYDGIHINGEAYLLWKNELTKHLGSEKF